MQTSNGEHHRQQHQAPYFTAGQYDPNLIAFAQHALLGYPAPHHKNILPQAFATQQLPSLMLPTQPTMLPPLQQQQMPARNLRPSLSIPDMDKMSMEEPIEAGNLPYRRGNNKSTTSASASMADDSFNLHRSTSSSSHNLRRHSAQWETMTDDEREMIQRQKRKEEAFKTALCDAYKRSGICPYGETCRFAHGENELRMPSQPRGKAHPKYKTQLCDKFSTYGQCPYGPRCQFIHKLKKGLPLLEYNRALYQGQISPARDDEITNPDESSGDQSALNLTRTLLRRRSASGNPALDMSDSGYSGCGGAPRRRLLSHYEQLEEAPRSKSTSSASGKVVYPSMQVVNIEMATSTGQKKSSMERRSGSQQPGVINQADYEASMAGGKIFGKPVDLQENIRTYGAMIRANEEHVERNQTGSKKERVKMQSKKDLSLIREEETLLVESQLHSSSSAPPVPPAPVSIHAQSQPWYEKIFGKKMTMIKEESDGEEEEDLHRPSELEEEDFEYSHDD